MLQPLQLQQVLAHCPAEIAELRSFLHLAGLPLDVEEALPDLCSRIQHDRGFRRDLTSHIWVISHAGAQPISLSDLLGILTVAAAGPHLATAATDADAHDLLRFLMEARRSFDGASIHPQVMPFRSPAAIAPPLAARTSAIPDDSAPVLLGRRHSQYDHEPETATHHGLLTDRRSVIALALAACLLLALGLTLWLHHPAATESTIASSPTTQPAATIVTDTPAPTPPTPTPHTAVISPAHDRTPAPVHPNTSNRLSQPTARGTGNSSTRKPSPLVEATPTPATTRTPSAPAQPSHNAARSASQPNATSNARSAHKRTAAPRPSTPDDTTGLIANVQPIHLGTDLGTANVGNRPAGTSAARAATVRPTSLGIMAANVTYSPAPSYPPAASAAHVQGEVKIEAEVGPDGNVSSARVISGPPLLREAAVSAIEQWRYRPYVADGHPITMSALIVMDFQLP